MKATHVIEVSHEPPAGPYEFLWRVCSLAGDGAVVASGYRPTTAAALEAARDWVRHDGLPRQSTLVAFVGDDGQDADEPKGL